MRRTNQKILQNKTKTNKQQSTINNKTREERKERSKRRSRREGEKNEKQTLTPSNYFPLSSIPLIPSTILSLLLQYIIIIIITIDYLHCDYYSSSSQHTYIYNYNNI